MQTYALVILTLTLGNPDISSASLNGITFQSLDRLFIFISNFTILYYTTLLIWHFYDDIRIWDTNTYMARATVVKEKLLEVNYNNLDLVLLDPDLTDNDAR